MRLNNYLSSSSQQLAGGLPPLVSGRSVQRGREAEARISLAVTALPRVVPGDLGDFCFLMRVDLGRHVERIPLALLQNRKEASFLEFWLVYFFFPFSLLSSRRRCILCPRVLLMPRQGRGGRDLTHMRLPRA